MHVRIDPATYWTWPSGKREWKGAAITKKIETRVPATQTSSTHPTISVYDAEKQANSRRPSQIRHQLRYPDQPLYTANAMV